MAKAAQLDVQGILAEIEQFKASKVEPIRQQILTLKGQRDELERKIWDLEKIEAQLTGKAVKGKASSGGGKRRSEDELRAEAERIVAYLKKHPNARARDFNPNRPQNMAFKEFIKKYTGATLNSQGEKAAMTYSIS